MMEWVNALECPRCKAKRLTINPKSNDELLPELGDAVCNQCNMRYSIRDHILDLAQPGDQKLLTLAGLSNLLPFLPWGYENVWRPRSLTILSGEKFPVEREIKLLNDWLNPQANEFIVDLGSSTDLYARGIGKQNPTTRIVAIDLAKGMLLAGRKYALRDGVKNIAHLRVPVQHLPFADASVDALVCGGSLNEFRSMREALKEARRVCKSNGRMFAMSLQNATTPAGKIGQSNARMSGITFPSLDQFNTLIAEAGWRCECQQVYGTVVFTLMKPSRI